VQKQQIDMDRVQFGQEPFSAQLINAKLAAVGATF